jgi:hypothetical protein
MTSECWLVQVWGVSECPKCPEYGKEDCGGKKIIETGKNELGYLVPLGKIKEGV